MRDYLFVSLFLGHDRGEETRRLLDEFDLLKVATADRMNRNASFDTHHTGVNLRLPAEDKRIETLLKRLQAEGVNPYTRWDREYTAAELDAADWLVMRIATAGLYGGVDYGQTYDFSSACETCGAGALPIFPLIAEIGKMGKKDIDHLVFEGHLVVTSRIVTGLSHLTGIDPSPIRSPRRPPDSRFAWLRITGDLPRMHPSTTGYETEGHCPRCGRGGHFGNVHEPEVPTYEHIPAAAKDFNRTYEYFGTWQQLRNPSQERPVGGGTGIVVSQRARQALKNLGVQRLVWVPVSTVKIKPPDSPIG